MTRHPRASFLPILYLALAVSGCGPEQTAPPAASPASTTAQPAQPATGDPPLTPSVYLLNHGHWTPVLVVNFAQEVAPWDTEYPGNDERSLAVEPAPGLEPALEGRWIWRDPSRLVFLPKLQTLQPETRLTLNLQGLQLRAGFSATSSPLAYQTPPLLAQLRDCSWHDILTPPMRRAPTATVEFNYPVYQTSFSGNLDGTPLPVSNGRGRGIKVSGAPLVRPSQTSAIRIEQAAGELLLLHRQATNLSQIPGAPARLAQGVSCQLTTERGAWDKIEQDQLQATQVQGIQASLVGDSIQVKLEGTQLSASQRKRQAGQPAESGVALTPALAGQWRYGDTDAGPDLVFTPAQPNPWPPGTDYQISVAAEAFPDAPFARPNLSTSLKTPSLAGRIEQLRLYRDPSDPQVKRITATLVLSHPPAPGSLEAHGELRLRLEPSKTFGDAKALPFRLTYDHQDPRRVYLKSDPLTIPDEPGEARLTLGQGWQSSLGGAGSPDLIAGHLAIPSRLDFFQVLEASTSTLDPGNGDIERLLSLQTSTPARDPKDLAKAVQAYLLPDCRVQPAERPPLCEHKAVQEWASPDQVDQAVLDLSEPVNLTWKDAGSEARTLQAFGFAAPERRQLFVQVKQGLESLDGFRLRRDARFLLDLDPYPRELKIQHQGALLSLSGDKKLGVMARGVARARVELQRVLPHNLHHLASFTQGAFANPSFSVPIQHFAEKFSYDEDLAPSGDLERQYFAVDFARFTQLQGEPPRGLFLLSVTDASRAASQPAPDDDAASDDDPALLDAPEPEAAEQDQEQEQEPDPAPVNLQDQRLVLITDLGILVKTQADGSQEVFLMSLRAGLPVAGAKVSLLGANGLPLFSGVSDDQGRVALPSARGLAAERQPTVYVAEKAGDLSFLPYDRSDRHLKMSRFDVGGVRDRPDSLSAYLFSDRGIYRPGDPVHFGLILRRQDWGNLPAGLPLKAVLRDPANQEVLSKTLAFSAGGFATLDWTSNPQGRTGTYRLELLVTDQQSTSLGSTSIRVEEFQPDRLQVKTEILGAPALGWLHPDGAKAKVTVRNLFGTPAAGGQTKLEWVAKPWSGQVPGFGGFRFRSDTGSLPHLPRDLGEAVTNDQGEAIYDLALGDLAEPLYELVLAGEGFEKASGRSVVGMASTLVSRHPYLLGHAADGDLDYIAKDSRRQLKLLALGPDLQPQDPGPVRVERHETRYVSTLVKRPDGLFAYQSTERDETGASESLALPGGQGQLTLATERPGSFYLAFKNAQGEELNRVYYRVAGTGNLAGNIERNAELQLSLSKAEYAPGEEVEVQILAPYLGAGLISIEQDRVIASQWIKTDSTASTHRIRLPAGIKGGAYLSVAFVRAMDSPEIFMSPLSYGLVYFPISRQEFTQKVTLQLPERVQSGTDLEVRYRVQEPTQLLVFAVDEGILQFARYRDPKPLDFFFRKRALQIRTHQILDLILPDHALARKLSKPGGDEDANGAGKYKNPFARKHKPPLAFWSGLIDATPGEHSLSIPVPDYFNGSIRVLAVAVNSAKMATSSGRVVARNPFVIQVQQPYAVAPGDEFEMGVLVANTTGDPGVQDLEVSAIAGPGLELSSINPQSLALGPGQDARVRFRARALERLGPVEVSYQVRSANHQAQLKEQMSVRPAQPLLTTLQNGVLRIVAQQAGQGADIQRSRDLYPEQAHADLSLSITPSAYLRGIIQYLKTYPYACLEQQVSQAFPALVLGANPELGLSAADVALYLEKTLRGLQVRQKHDGSFAYWNVTGPSMPFYSMYATHLLLEARQAGHKIPDELLQRALAYADDFSQQTHYEWEEHRAQAYALYLLARSGKSVGPRLKAFDAELARQWGQGGVRAYWTRFFLGAAFKIQHLDQDAERLFGEFQREWQSSGHLPLALQGDVGAISQYLYLANQHFPELIDAQDPKFGEFLYELAQDLVKRRVNSFSGSLAALGLGSLWQRFGADGGQGFQLLAGQPPAAVALSGQTVKRAELAPDTGTLHLTGAGTWNLYYQLTEQGYDRHAPSTPINQGLTLSRQLLDDAGQPTQDLNLRDKLRVRLALHPDQPIQDLALVMLIPGGFEIDLSDEGLGRRQSLPIEGKTLWEPEHIEVQEDRVLMFGNLSGGERYFEFRLKPLNAGSYQVPPVLAEGMYDTRILHRGLAERIQVHE